MSERVNKLVNESAKEPTKTFWAPLLLEKTIFSRNIPNGQG